MSDKKPKKPGDGAYNRRRPFKRLSEMDRIRLLNAETRHLQAEDQRTTKELNEAGDRLKRDLDRADTKHKKRLKLDKTIQQRSNRAVNDLNKAQWKVNRLLKQHTQALKAQKNRSAGRAGVAGAIAYALSDKYLTPLAEKAGAKLGKWLKSKVKPGSTHPRKKDYVMGNNGNWVKRTAYKSKK